VKAAEAKAAEVKAAEVKAAVRAEADPVSARVAETEAVVAKTEAIAIDAPVALPEKIVEAALSGEVLPPEVRAPASGVMGFQAIAQAYGEYTRNSWSNGRLLTERLIAVRSFDEAIEIQGEFARQAYANFLNQSQKMCVLYGEWAQQFFRPFVWRR
jgi:Phasin protein